MASLTPLTNGAGEYPVTVRTDLATSACTICLCVAEGLGVDAAPVDVVCMTCAKAIARALEIHESLPSPSPQVAPQEEPSQDEPSKAEEEREATPLPTPKPKRRKSPAKPR